MASLRQHVAANSLHRAELLYLECWKGKRILAANLPRFGIGSASSLSYTHCECSRETNPGSHDVPCCLFPGRLHGVYADVPSRRTTARAAEKTIRKSSSGKDCARLS